MCSGYGHSVESCPTNAKLDQFARIPLCVSALRVLRDKCKELYAPDTPRKYCTLSAIKTKRRQKIDKKELEKQKYGGVSRC